MSTFSPEEIAEHPEMPTLALYPFKRGAERVQQIAKKVLPTILPFPKPPKSPRSSASLLSDGGAPASPTEKLNQLIGVHNLFCDLMESADIFGVILNAMGKIRDASMSIDLFLGYKPCDLVGCEGRSFIHPEDWKRVKLYLASWDRKEGRGFQFRCKSVCSGWKWVRAALFSHPSGESGFFLLGMPFDPVPKELC